jgi:hypothetical protein
MLSQSLLGLLALTGVASAHFQMLYPSPRTTDDETEPTGPCGGQKVSNNRTTISTNDFPVALQMGHDQTVIQMLLALGNDPGDNFNITLEKTFQQQGEGNFCLPHVMIPAGVTIADGSNGTLQVVTDGEGGGGLYVVSSSGGIPKIQADIYSAPTSHSRVPRLLFLRPARTVPV